MRRGYTSATSRKGALLRHMPCRVTASFQTSATSALRGPVRSAIARALQRSRGQPRFRRKIALTVSNRHFRMGPSPRFEPCPFRLISPDS